jgi:hypothetical protein
LMPGAVHFTRNGRSVGPVAAVAVGHVEGAAVVGRVETEALAELTEEKGPLYAR